MTTRNYAGSQGKLQDLMQSFFLDLLDFLQRYSIVEKITPEYFLSLFEVAQPSPNPSSLMILFLLVSRSSFIYRLFSRSRGLDDITSTFPSFAEGKDEVSR